MRRTWRWRGYEVCVRTPKRSGGSSRADSELESNLEVGTNQEELRTISRDGNVETFRESIRELGHYDSQSVQRESLSLADRVRAMYWYHTIDLGDGIVTGGMFDHRPLVDIYGLPDDLRGQRVLDVGTWDGFWAFEFERRGASVIALDLDRFSKSDFPPGYQRVLEESGFDYRFGEGFEAAHKALGSGVQRVVGNVYDLDEAVDGKFDLVHVADVLLHLEVPTRALKKIHQVTRGEAVLVMAYDPGLSDNDMHVASYRGGWERTTWWIPSLDTCAQMILDAGFSRVRLHKTYRLVPLDGTPGLWRAIFYATP